MEKTLSNHFLVAFPNMPDSTFSKSVIYLYEHNEHGAMGLIVNKPMKMKLGEVFQHMNITAPREEIVSEPVMMGGPIGQDHGFVLYVSEPEKDSDQDQEVSISSSKETLTAIANNEGPEDFLIVLGYSGWEAGQLEIELYRNDWLIAPFDPRILFMTPVENRWRAAAKLIGVDVDSISTLVGHG